MQAIKLHEDKLSCSLPISNFLRGWHKRELDIDPPVFISWYLCESLRYFVFLHHKNTALLVLWEVTKVTQRLRELTSIYTVRLPFISNCCSMIIDEFVHLHWKWYTYPHYTVLYASLVLRLIGAENRTPPFHTHLYWLWIRLYFITEYFLIFCQLHCGCLCAKRIPVVPYKIAIALLRNKPTSMEGFAEPTQR